MDFENFCGAGVTDCLFLFEGCLDIVVYLDFGIWVEGGELGWGPFCMHFPDSFLDVESDIYLLTAI